MSPAKKVSVISLPVGAIVAVLSAPILGGCVVRVAAPPPAPPAAAVVEEAPPPAAEVAVPDPEAEVRVNEPPPALPDYEQPACPVEGYIWTPGYWHWNGVAYYWVPGTWVGPPRVGVVWTPAYWGFVGGVYVFHAGYWGPHVGFYGGINYGYGYTGAGYAGGRWVGNRFSYNTTVTHVNTTIVHNTYNQTVVNNITINKVSYNGGAGGVAATPNAQERLAARETHVQATPVQHQHIMEAAKNPFLSAKANGGHPQIAATARPGAFTGPGVVRANGAPAQPLKDPGQGFKAQGQGSKAGQPVRAMNQPGRGPGPNAAPGQQNRAAGNANATNGGQANGGRVNGRPAYNAGGAQPQAVRASRQRSPRPSRIVSRGPSARAASRKSPLRAKTGARAGAQFASRHSVREPALSC